MDDDDLPENRATLADVLGALVTSVSRARVQADLSSIEIARLYMTNDLLRGMPVPRLRLNRVEVSIPLVVTAARPAEPYELSDHADAAKALLGDLKQALNEIKRLNAQLDDDLGLDEVVAQNTSAHRHLMSLNASLKDLRKAMDASVTCVGTNFHFESRFANAIERALANFHDKSAHNQTTGAVDVQEAAGKAIAEVLTFKIALHRGSVRKNRPEGFEFDPADWYPELLGETKPIDLDAGGGSKSVDTYYARLRAAIPELLSRMHARAGLRAFSKPPKVPEIEIAAHSADVKNLGTPGTITHLRMVMSEEGLEWVAETADDGGRDWKLMPE